MYLQRDMKNNFHQYSLFILQIAIHHWIIFPFLQIMTYNGCNLQILISLGAFTDYLVFALLEEEISKAKETRKYLPAVSTSLALAAGIGLLEAAALISGSGFLMNAMGISVVCPKLKPA